MPEINQLGSLMPVGKLVNQEDLQRDEQHGGCVIGQEIEAAIVFRCMPRSANLESAKRLPSETVDLVAWHLAEPIVFTTRASGAGRRRVSQLLEVTNCGTYVEQRITGALPVVRTARLE